jgi:hypothetical protein
MRKFLNGICGLAVIAASALICQASYGQASSMKTPSLVGVPQIDCAVPAMVALCADMKRKFDGSSSGIGNRIIKFSGDAGGYVRAKQCELSRIGGTGSGVSVISVYSDGTKLYQVPGRGNWNGTGDAFTAESTCYFSGEAGVFTMSPFDNANNISYADTGAHIVAYGGVSGDNCSGYFQSVTKQATRNNFMLDPLTGINSASGSSMITYSDVIDMGGGGDCGGGG